MYCRHCGKEIPDQSSFCPYCGEKVETLSGDNNETVTSEKAAHYEPSGTKQHSHKKILIIALSAAAVIVLLFVYNFMQNRPASGEMNISSAAESDSASILQTSEAAEASSITESVESDREITSVNKTKDSKNETNLLESSNFDVNPTVANSDYSDGYIQIYDMDFQVGGVKTFREESAVIESSSLFKGMTNSEGKDDDGSIPDQYQDFTAESSSLPYLDIYYYVDEQELFLLHLVSPSDEEDVSLGDYYVNNIELGAYRFVYIDNLHLETKANDQYLRNIYFAGGINALGQLNGKILDSSDIESMVKDEGYGLRPKDNSWVYTNYWEEGRYEKALESISLYCSSETPSIKDADGQYKYSHLNYTFSINSDGQCDGVSLEGLFFIDEEQYTPRQGNQQNENATDAATILKEYQQTLAQLEQDYGKAKATDESAPEGEARTTQYKGIIFADTYDINQDGVPELLVGYNRTMSDFYINSVMLLAYFWNGKKVEGADGLGNCELTANPGGQGFSIVVDDKGQYYIHTLGDAEGSDITNDSYYYLGGDNKFTLKEYLYGEYNGEDSDLHQINGENVSLNELNTELMKYTEVAECNPYTVSIHLSDGDSTDSEDITDSSETSDSDQQVFGESSDRLIGEDEVEDLSNDKLQTAINEIYARHGYTFKDPDILAHFKQFSWYKPTVSASDFSKSVFSETENKNIELFQSHMNK